MEWLAEFHFIRPLWLIALVPVGLLAYFLYRHLARASSWQKAIDPALIPFLLVKPPLSPSMNPLPLLVLAWIIAILALAGPTQEKVPQPILEREDALVIVLDLTWSMYAADLSPSRLVTAKRKITDLLNGREEGMTALISFAGDAHTVAPLTDDTGTLLALLPALSPEIMPGPGSRLAPALTLARALFTDGGAASGRVLVITDEIRDQGDAIDAARELGSAYALTILAAGTESGAPIKLPESMGESFLKDEQGNLVIPSVDFNALSNFAKATGADVSRLNLLSDDTEALLAPPTALDETFRIIERDFDLWRELGPYLIFLLVPLAVAGFRRGWLWGFALVFFLPIERVQADWWTDLWQTRDQQGFSALMEDTPDIAARLFEDPAWQSTAHYRNQDFEQASDGFSAGGTATDQYNLGNSLAKMGDLTGAIAAYEGLLAQNPQHEDALFNKALVEKLLQEQSESESESSDSESSDGDQDQPSQDGQNSDDSEDSAQATDDADSESTQSQPQDSDDSSDDNSKTESAEQDAQDETPSDEARSAETAESELDPEEAQALEQWLRRVPDDPGGLLRRKFEQQFEDRVRQGEITRQDFERNW